MAGREITAPSPALFDPDSVEQIYAKGSLDRNLAGLSALMGYGARLQRGNDRDKYLGALNESNKQSAYLGEREANYKMKTENAKTAAGLAKDGYLPSTLSGSGDIFTDVPKADEFALLQQDLVRAEAMAKRAAAAKAAAGGGDEPQVTYTPSYVPYGNNQGAMNVTVKGKNQAKVEAALARVKAGIPSVLGPNVTDPKQIQAIQTQMMLQGNNKYGAGNVED
jgi:hypothetical protein